MREISKISRRSTFTTSLGASHYEPSKSSTDASANTIYSLSGGLSTEINHRLSVNALLGLQAVNSEDDGNLEFNRETGFGLTYTQKNTNMRSAHPIRQRRIQKAIFRRRRDLHSLSIMHSMTSERRISSGVWHFQRHRRRSERPDPSPTYSYLLTPETNASISYRYTQEDENTGNSDSHYVFMTISRGFDIFR